MTQQKIILQKEHRIATVTINDPAKLNALNSEILRELDAAFDELSADPEIRVIILTGAERSFVAGADIQAMSEMNYAEAKVFGEFGSSVFRKIETCPKPVIAAVNGFALGGGCELALACDIRLASEKAKLGQPEVSLGICPGFSGTQRLARLIGVAKAKELIFTGKVITADEALKIGLVNQVTPPETLMEEVNKMAETIAKQASVAVSNSKRAINDGWDMEISEGIDLEVELFARCFETEDQKLGMKAFLNKEKATFNGK